MLPSLFLAHGLPTLIYENNKYTRFLRNIPTTIIRSVPRAVVVFSSHWESNQLEICSTINYKTMQDSPKMTEHPYNIAYPAKGDIGIALEIQQSLLEEGINATLNDTRELDLSAWFILHLLYPMANIPVILISINPNLVLEEQYRIGKAIALAKTHDILILGSGGTVANLSNVRLPIDQHGNRAMLFDNWIKEQIETWNIEKLFILDELAPYAKWAVPAKAQIIPLIITMGAGDKLKNGTLLHREYMHGSLSLSAWCFS